MILLSQPKTFVIALKGHLVSEKQLQDCLESAKKFNWNLEIFWGTKGIDITDEDWLTIGVKPLYHKKTMDRPGTWGCFFSHWHLWNKCVEIQEPIVILEHDAVITNFWKPIELNSLTKLHEHLKLKSSRKWIDPDSGKCSSSTHAYCLSPDHAKKLIDFSKTVGAFATDRMIGDKVLPIAHSGKPSLVVVQNTFSTTNEI
jgi:hypothetical protein